MKSLMKVLAGAARHVHDATRARLVRLRLPALGLGTFMKIFAEEEARRVYRDLVRDGKLWSNLPGTSREEKPLRYSTPEGREQADDADANAVLLKYYTAKVGAAGASTLPKKLANKDVVSGGKWAKFDGNQEGVAEKPFSMANMQLRDFLLRQNPSSEKLQLSCGTLTFLFGTFFLIFFFVEGINLEKTNIPKVRQIASGDTGFWLKPKLWYFLAQIIPSI